MFAMLSSKRAGYLLLKIRTDDHEGEPKYLKINFKWLTAPATVAYLMNWFLKLFGII